MLVSAQWLRDYVDFDLEIDELTERLSMSGMNHESTETVGDDLAVDLEVTNNRPDWLGHIGVAREIAVLLDLPLTMPDPQPKEAGARIDEQVEVVLECPDHCPRYTARIIRGVQVGPSPDWLVEKLQVIGQPSVNNIVDITNFVLMECGQPLHAFDLAKLKGRKIAVRTANRDEKLNAIDHNLYDLTPAMCVIADAERPVAIGGVMGGADTEVSEQTVDLLIEAAEFSPLSIRNTARALKLHSDSSYRFERTVDSDMVDWASRRCCELILELAGGELAEGVIDAGKGRGERAPVALRHAQIPRVLGIDIALDECRRILTALGCVEVVSNDQQVEVIPPSWRRDLTREIDLIEEVARVHGYDEIPEDTKVPMAVSHRSDADRALERTRNFLTAQGFDEAMTRSIVSEDALAEGSPWGEVTPLKVGTPMIKGETAVRTTLIPSLLEARRDNEANGNDVVELFETASVYLAREGNLPDEQRTLALVSGRDYFEIKGVIESLICDVAPDAKIEVGELQSASLLDEEQSCELRSAGQRLAVVGVIGQAAGKQRKLRTAATAAELNLDRLFAVAKPVRTFQEMSSFPSIERDLNVIVDESVRWIDLESIVHEAGGECLADLAYLDTYRDPETDGEGKKRLLFRVIFQSDQRTLTNEEADAFRDAIVDRLAQSVGGRLLD